MAELPSQERRSCERRVRRRLAECCVAGSEVGGTSCADAVRRAAAAEPASILLRVVEAASKPVVQRRSLAAHRNCCGAPRACGEVRGSSGNRSSGRCARSITEAERSAGAAAVDGSTVIRRKSMAQDSAGLRSSRLRHGVAAFLFHLYKHGKIAAFLLRELRTRSLFELLLPLFGLDGIAISRRDATCSWVHRRHRRGV